MAHSRSGNGEPPTALSLRDGAIFGRSKEADFLLADPAVSRRHARIEKTATGWCVRDLGSRTGTFVNGRLCMEYELVYGDMLRMGNHSFRFEGIGLLPVSQAAGAELISEGVCKTVGAKRILSNVTLRVNSGKFAGILGPSGAGKSTLLDALSGIRGFSAGKVLIAGEPLRAFLRRGSTACGYVPQEDIVHGELTVAEAIDFSARLRLGRDVPMAERVKLVQQTIEQLGLRERAVVRVQRLSGGQRKRVSIATEVLAKPAILFLDEPSSGLDPATEFKLMELLRDLANLGCTVVCTTHVMENVYLFDQLLVVAAGRLIFSGPPDAARSHFEVERFATLYDRIEEEPAEFWDRQFVATTPTQVPQPAPLPVPEQKIKPPAFYPILLARQWAILCSDGRLGWSSRRMLPGKN